MRVGEEFARIFVLYGALGTIRSSACGFLPETHPSGLDNEQKTMRVRNKELRNKWKRKEEKIKQLKREAIAAGKKPAAPKAAPAPKAEAAPKAAAPKKAAAATADKPKKAPAKKKAEAAE